jgi:6-phosphogluconolactonase
LYALLAQSPYRERLAWEKVHVFWGDERVVPHEDDRYNAKMAFELLLNHVPIPAAQIHPMSGELPPEESARQYEALLRGHFGNQPPRFDLILLGMGDDGHTASLFPYTPVLQEKSRWVSELYLESQQMYRITLTAPLLNQAHQIAFLVTGATKAATLYEVLHGERRPDRYPSQLIRTESSSTHWFLDKAAAAQLSTMDSSSQNGITAE